MSREPFFEPSNPRAWKAETPQLVYETYSGLFSDSTELAKRLRAVLAVGSEATKATERRALWHSLLLDYDCEYVLAEPEIGLYTQQKDPERAARLLGGASLCRFLLPFDDAERQALSGGERIRLMNMWHFDPQNNDQPDPALLRRWHDWLMQFPELTLGDVQRPAAALERAVSGLAATISELTGWPFD